MEQETKGIKNGFYFNESYDPNDPSTFSGTAQGWEAGAAFNSSGRLVSIFMLFSMIQGNMNLDGCEMLNDVVLYSADISAISVLGCTALSVIDISNNAKLTEFDISTNINLSEVIAQGNSRLTALDFSHCPRLTAVRLNNIPLKTVNFDGCRELSIIAMSNTDITELDLSDAGSLYQLYLRDTLLTEIDATSSPYLSTSNMLGGETYKRIRLALEAPAGKEASGRQATRAQVFELSADGNGGVGYMNAEYPYYAIAYPSFGAEFIGWYENDVLISNEKKLSVNAMQQFEKHELIAKFEGGAPMPSGSARDIHLMRTFLEHLTYIEATDALVTHGQAMNPNYDCEDFTTFPNATFNDNNRIATIDYSGHYLQGPITLDYSELTSFKMDNCNISGITVIGCDMLTEISANDSFVVLPCDFSGAPKLERLDLDGLVISMDGERLEALELSNNTQLTHLSCVGSHVSTVLLNTEAFGGGVSLLANEGGYIGCTYESGVFTAIAQPDSLAFAGWYDAALQLYSNELSLTLPTGNEIRLYARFGSGFIMGDTNSDGVVSTDDALLVIRYAMGLLNLNAEQLKLSDLNGDSVVDFTDALRVLRVALGYGNE